MKITPKEKTFSIPRLISNIVLLIFLFVSFTLNSTNQSRASVTRDRIRICSPEGGAVNDAGIPVSVEGLDFRPTSGGKDVQFELDNPVCLTVMAITYATVKSMLATMNGVCGTGSKIPRIKPSLLEDAWEISKAFIEGSKRAANGDWRCLSAAFGASASFNILMVELGIIYGIAKDGFDNTTLCGADWMKWNSKTLLKDSPDQKARINSIIRNRIDAQKSTDELNLDNLEYREWYYGGIEKEDNSEDGYCEDVKRDKINGKYPPQRYYMRGSEASYLCEQYNIRQAWADPKTGGGFSADRVKDYNRAYECCQRRSRESICLQYGDSYKFCNAGSKCTLNKKGLIITFESHYKYSDTLICAQSYSVCPYNFNIAGGTTECDYYQDGVWDDKNKKWKLINADVVSGKDCAGENENNSNCSTRCKGKSEIREPNCSYNSKAGKCRNYCQLLNHCVVTNSSYIYETNITSPYFSTACLNFAGDSQNNYNYDSGIIAGNQHHFTAPIAQCIRETLENVFYNRAGHSHCKNPGEVPNARGECSSQTYVYKQGNQVAEQGFFSIIQSRIQLLVRLTLIMSITFMGIKILMGGKFLERKELIMFVVKLGLIMWFATGNAWQQTFFDGVYRASESFSTLVMKMRVSPNIERRDGCQFGEIATPKLIDSPTGEIGASGKAITKKELTVSTEAVGNPYPIGKGYLAIWDTLDCKIARYLGFGPTASVANIAKLILAGYFTGPIGIYFSVLTMIFGIFLVLFALRMLYIFLASAMAIILMVYVSPIVIPLVLFKKTENIFKNWIKELLSYSLQPILLFAYIGIFVTIFDEALTGSATFNNSPPMKTLNCEKKCMDADGKIKSIPQSKTVYDNDSNGVPFCDISNNDVILDPETDSVVCLINVDRYQTWPGLEFIGIGIPMILDIFTKPDVTRAKILTMAKALLLIYILAELAGEIPAIAANLTGGSQLPSMDNKSLKDIATRSIGIARALQKRGMGAGKKVAGRIVDGLTKKGGSGKKEADNPFESNTSDMANRNASNNHSGKKKNDVDTPPDMFDNNNNNNPVGSSNNKT